MNKLILFGLLALLFGSTSGDIACISWRDYFSYQNLEDEEDICSSLTPTTTGYTHCCYMQIDDNEPSCAELTDDQYENIGRFIKYLEDLNGNDPDIDIYCSSQFLSLSLFAVAALLF